jgi:DNA-binding MarR family transcriptional regulator
MVAYVVDDREALAGEVWRKMFGFMIETRPQRDAVLARLGLTPTEAKALSSLHGDDGRSMKELAAEWSCDASTATWAINRLEHLSLVERRPHPRDRRIRLVVLTSHGTRAKGQLLQGMYVPPRELHRLDLGELRTLSNLLTRLTGTASAADES